MRQPQRDPARRFDPLHSTLPSLSGRPHRRTSRGRHSRVEPSLLHFGRPRTPSVPAGCRITAARTDSEAAPATCERRYRAQWFAFRRWCVTSPEYGRESMRRTSRVRSSQHPRARLDPSGVVLRRVLRCIRHVFGIPCGRLLLSTPRRPPYSPRYLCSTVVVPLPGSLDRQTAATPSLRQSAGGRQSMPAPAAIDSTRGVTTRGWTC